MCGFPLFLWQTVGHCMFYLPNLARPVIIWHTGFVRVDLTYHIRLHEKAHDLKIARENILTLCPEYVQLKKK